MARSPRIPKYRRHSSGQARVTLDGKDHLLGPFGSAASKEAYQRLVAEWLTSPVKPPDPARKAEPLTVSELILAYWKFASEHYGFGADPGRGDRYCLRDALKVVRSLYGRTPALTFGPLSLKACRQAMIARDWSRGYVNAQVDRVCRMFRWAAEEELLPGSVYQNVRAVPGLRYGKSEARETVKVRPVPQGHVDAALPFLAGVVRAMVQFQQLTGCRPAEVCVLRPADVDRSNPACWVYRPGSDEGRHGAHKTAHHGHDRLVLVGPRAQAVLRPYLGGQADGYCFRPADAVTERNARQRQRRKTPLYPSHLARLAARRKPSPKRAPGDRYTTRTYGQAVTRACRKAGVPAWSPNRLRHTTATELRRHGLDLAKTVLGHSKIETTLVYAEKDLQAAMELVARIG
jgi:integrase